MFVNVIYLVTLTVHECLVVFAVDPQDEAERNEQRLAIIADHLGFSWTGKSHYVAHVKLKLSKCVFFLIKTKSGCFVFGTTD